MAAVHFQYFTDRSMNRIFAAIFPILLSACAGQFKSQLNFNPQEPLRVAVLPFVTIDKTGKIEDKEARLIVDNLSILSKDLEQTPAQIVRKQVLIELKRSPLDLLSTALIDIDIPHHGFAVPGGKVDLAKLYNTNPTDLCTKFLTCDAVLYGRVTEWDRSYYGIQSVNSVGIELNLVSAKTKKVLFSSTAKDSESRGLTKGPTGYTALVLEPVKGLDSQIIVDLARRIVSKMLAPLEAKNQPEFLQSEAPAIFAVSHDAPTGRFNGALLVLMMGSSGQTGSFSIGRTIKNVPMFERSPGNYYGEYIALPTDSFREQDVIVSLRDRFGRVTESKVALPSLTYP